MAQWHIRVQWPAYIMSICCQNKMTTIYNDSYKTALGVFKCISVKRQECVLFHGHTLYLWTYSITYSLCSSYHVLHMQFVILIIRLTLQCYKKNGLYNLIEFNCHLGRLMQQVKWMLDGAWNHLLAFEEVFFTVFIYFCWTRTLNDKISFVCELL